MLNVAAIHALAYYFMAEVAAKFMTQRPSAGVAPLGRRSSGVVELEDAGHAEIGLVYDSAVASEEPDITLRLYSKP